MRSLIWFSNTNRVRVGRLYFVTVALCLILGPATRVRAQEVAKAVNSSCISPSMLQQMGRDGNSIIVTTAASSDNSPGRVENEHGINAAQSQDSTRMLQQARRWFEKAAHKGYAPAQVNLAVLSLVGWGVPSNPGAALYWLTEAAHQNYPLAYFDLGILYLNGCGVRQDYSEAFRYFQEGADAGDLRSQMNLGYLYDQGFGVPRDRARAAVWYRKSAEAGELQAQFNLADLYLRGEGVPLDESRAFVWFEKAAKQGHSTACIMLASMYAAGRGAAKDPAAAYYWFYAAALQGDLRARAELASLERQLGPPEIAEAQLRAQSLASLRKKSSNSLLGLLH